MRAAGDGDPRPDGTGSDESARLARLIAPVVAARSMDLEDVRVSAAGRHRLLRVVVDADGGVGLDDIARVSQDLSAALDESQAMGERPYTLEVSSPGVTRPLTQPRHWRRAVGRLVTAQLLTRRGTTRPGSVTGRVVAADESAVTIDVVGVQRSYGYPELGAGRVQVEFGRLGDEHSPGKEAPDGH